MLKNLVIDSKRMLSGKQIRYWCRKCNLSFYSEQKRNAHAYEIHIVGQVTKGDKG